MLKTVNQFVLRRIVLTVRLKVLPFLLIWFPLSKTVLKCQLFVLSWLSWLVVRRFWFDVVCFWFGLLFI
jgi:hypothetical protein